MSQAILQDAGGLSGKRKIGPQANEEVNQDDQIS